MRIVILLFLLFSQMAYPCAPLLGESFKPFMENSFFSETREPKTPNATAKVQRAKEFVPSCWQPSFLTIEIENVNQNPNAGYIFRYKGEVISGLELPDGPIISSSVKYFTFYWLESEIELSKPVEATIEVIAILPNSKKSNPFYLKVYASGH